jgi:RNA polymerase sigma-B factor
MRQPGPAPRDVRVDETNACFDALAATSDPVESEQLRRRIVELNIDVARSAARRYRNRGVALEDLQQVACVGLVKAINGFRPDHGVDFLGYAIPTISGELKRYFRDHGWLVRPTRSVQELHLRAGAAATHLRQRHGHEPTVHEIASELGEETEQVRRAVGAHACFSGVSLESAVSDGDFPLSTAVGEHEAGFVAAEARVVLRPALRRLASEYRRVLSLRFDRGMSQRDIGVVLGLSQMQVSRILRRILDELRDAIDAPPVHAASSA